MMLVRRAVVLMVVAGVAVVGLSLCATAFNLGNLGNLNERVWVVSQPTYTLAASKSGRIDYSSEVEVFAIGMIAGLKYKLTLSVPAWADFDILVMDRDENIVGVGILGKGKTEIIFITPRYTGPVLVGIGSSNGATGNFTLRLWRRT